MSPSTNIDGTEITGATIDGQDVQEITVDGDTVFTAIPDSGVDDFGNASDVAAFDTPDGFSIAMWLNLDSTGGSVFAARRNDDGDYSWEATTNNGNGLALRVNSNTNIAQGDGSNIVTGVWQHYVGTYDGSTIRVYVDGSEIASTSYSATVQTNDAAISLGARANFAGAEAYYSGDMDDARFYNKGLSATEVSNLYNNGDIRG